MLSFPGQTASQVIDSFIKWLDCVSGCFYLLGLHTNIPKDFFLSEIIITHLNLVYVLYQRTNSQPKYCHFDIKGIESNMDLYFCQNHLALLWVTGLLPPLSCIHHIRQTQCNLQYVLENVWILYALIINAKSDFRTFPISKYIKHHCKLSHWLH